MNEQARKKILVVDDDAVILKTTSMKLELQGYQVLLAREASEAIRMARKERPALILMDVSLAPEVTAGYWDGFLLMWWLQRLEQTKDIPVIIMTGSETENLRDKAAVNGAAAFFLKPIDHRALVSVIERVATKSADSGFEPS